MPKVQDKINTSNIKRLFIAIDLPLSVKSYLYEQAKKYFGDSSVIRIIPPENIHLTLKFLGDTDILKIQRISTALKEASGNFNKFDFKLDSRFEAFPSVSSPRILFAAVSQGADTIKELLYIVENNLVKMRIKKEERNFVCHITVARVREKLNLSNAAETAVLSYPDDLHCNRLTLFESRLHPGGAQYTIIEEFALK